MVHDSSIEETKEGEMSSRLAWGYVERPYFRTDRQIKPKTNKKT